MVKAGLWNVVIQLIRGQTTSNWLYITQ